MVDISIEIPESVLATLGDLAGGALVASTEAAVMGTEVELRNHFAGLQRRPRRDGLRSTGFWFGADGNSVAEHITGGQTNPDGTAQITIASPELGHKIKGGTIRAADYGHPYLTIPANDEAAAAPQGARSFRTRIEWVEHPDGGVRPALVAEGNYVAARRNNKTGKVSRRVTHVAARANAGADDVLFWLVRQVTHQPMADALPTQSTLDNAAFEAAEDAIAGLVAQAQGGAA